MEAGVTEKSENKDYYDAVLQRLDTLKQTGNEFNEAARGQVQESAARGVGSEQVQKEAPGMDLKPKGPMADDIARDAHNNSMAKDDAQAKSYLDRYENLQNSNTNNFNENSNDGNSKD